MTNVTTQDWEFWQTYEDLYASAAPLSSDDIRRFEFRLRERPLSIELRLKLCVHYLKGTDAPALRGAAEIGLWFAKHHPAAPYEFLSLFNKAFSFGDNILLKEELIKIWEENLAQHKDSPQVVHNAVQALTALKSGPKTGGRKKARATTIIG